MPNSSATHAATSPPLRSEDMQDIIEQVPASLLRWGISAVTLLLMLFFATLYWIQVPEVVQAPVALPATGAVTLQVPQKYLTILRAGQPVLLQLESYPAELYGSVRGTVVTVSPQPNTQGTLAVTIGLPKLHHPAPTTQHRQVQLLPHMRATATIVTAEVRLIDKLFLSATGR